jgi:hypothetical protein
MIVWKSSVGIAGYLSQETLPIYLSITAAEEYLDQPRYTVDLAPISS